MLRACSAIRFNLADELREMLQTATRERRDVGRSVRNSSRRQFAAVFQFPELGLAFQVALPAKAAVATKDISMTTP